MFRRNHYGSCPSSPPLELPYETTIVQATQCGQIEGESLTDETVLESGANIDAPSANTSKRDGVLLGHVAVFALGALSAVQVANYTVTVLSIVCLLLVPAFLLMEHTGTELLPLVLAVGGWISYAISSLLNEVTLLWPNALAPASFSLYLIGISVLTGRAVDKVATVLAGIGAGTVFFFVGKGIELTHTGSFLDLWKYGIAPGVTVLLVYGLTIVGTSFLVQAAALGLLGIASLALNFRSHALVCLVTAAIFVTHHYFAARLRRGWRFIVILGFGIAFSYIMPLAARAGLFGPTLREKTIEQETDNLPILLAGRTEPPMSLTAIADRPLLGWGSALNLTPDVYTRAEHVAISWGYPADFEFAGYWRLPASDYSAIHSILLGSWAEGGLIAALLPAWLLIACLAIVWNYPRFGGWAPLAVVVALQGIWDLLYAPWTYNTTASYACIAVLYSAVHFRRRPVVP